mmetsp:Transcript_30389/g.51332  ORF Transcript_30389/g.51332 Transcript_30389/m.51332 type:complete len:210 (+) Transcript_30389:190-819(+)
MRNQQTRCPTMDTPAMVGQNPSLRCISDQLLGVELLEVVGVVLHTLNAHANIKRRRPHPLWAPCPATGLPWGSMPPSGGSGWATPPCGPRTRWRRCQRWSRCCSQEGQGAAAAQERPPRTRPTPKTFRTKRWTARSRWPSTRSRSGKRASWRPRRWTCPRSARPSTARPQDPTSSLSRPLHPPGSSSPCHSRNQWQTLPSPFHASNSLG